MIFKNCGIIPKEIRPPIHVSLARTLDDYTFDIMQHQITAVCAIGLLSSISYLLYLGVYKNKAPSYGKLASSEGECDFDLSSDIELTCECRSLDLESGDSLKCWCQSASVSSASSDFQDKRLPDGLVSSSSSISITNKKIADHIQRTGGYKPYNCWHLSPVILTMASWYLLNFVYYFRMPISRIKDFTSWGSYVLGHFFVPLFTSIWLYVFHAPGALKLFSYGLGFQNICGVLTHLTLPTAPPWYFTIYGANDTANYDMPGYAAGLTRVDVEMGTHLHSDGFHKSPIVFGAVPSLHSAMAVMCFYFISYYSRWTILKVAALFFICIQWWATIYLEHHWRIDLLVGMLYSLVTITILRFWKGGFNKVDKDFIEARLEDDFQRGSTMGMRVFSNTKWESFFDPLS